MIDEIEVDDDSFHEVCECCGCCIDCGDCQCVETAEAEAQAHINAIMMQGFEDES